MSDKMDALLGRLEQAFDRWLEEFEHRPVATGLKTLVVFWILRWAWRSFR